MYIAAIAREVPGSSQKMKPKFFMVAFKGNFFSVVVWRRGSKDFGGARTLAFSITR